MRNLLLSALGSIVLLSACSGRVALDSAGTSGGTNGGSSGSVQCTAVPACTSDEELLALTGPRDPAVYACPMGRECNVRELCGSFAFCAKSIVACRAVPSCDVGDQPISQNQGCNTVGGDSCYTRTVCGTTIYCAKPKCNETRCSIGDQEIGEIPDCKAAGCPPVALPVCPEGNTCYTRKTCEATVYCATTKE
jgi:hypothetical protein